MEPMSPQEQFNYRWPLPHVAGSPDLGVLSVSLTSTRSSDPSHLFFGLAGPTGLPEPDGSPLFTSISLIACWRYEPREHLRPLAIARAAIPPSPLRDRVGYSVHCRSGLQPPCLRFATAVTGRHARLGTRLLARLYRGRHLRRLSSTRLQGATRSWVGSRRGPGFA